MRIKKNFIINLFFLIVVFTCYPLLALSPEKTTAREWITDHSAELGSVSDDIWRYAEIAMTEYKSSRRLADLLEKYGFRVERNVAGMPTAFVATYGSNEPVIGILAEYDALPGLSQKAIPKQEPVEAGKPGHGCGHNLFGAASVGGALAVKSVIEKFKIPGTIKLYGCPAEETVDGKVFMVRAGLFDGVSAVLHWHPGDSTRASLGSSLAMNSFKVTFFGKTAHAAGAPWEGRSALDAVELMNHAVNMMREHVKPTVRMHYVITNGGRAPNIVPNEATVWYFVRDLDRKSVEEAYAWMLKIAEGAALATQTTYKIHSLTGVHETIPNRTGAELIQKNLESIGPPLFTEEEQIFAKTIQTAIGKKQQGLHSAIAPLEEPKGDTPMGSTDVADVGWQTPVAGFTVATEPAGTPGHHWSAVACGGMSIGKKGMEVAAKALAFSAIDLLENAHVLQTMRDEWKQRMIGRSYNSPIPPEQKPCVVPESE